MSRIAVSIAPPIGALAVHPITLARLAKYGCWSTTNGRPGSTSLTSTRCAICCHCIQRQSQTVWRHLENALEIYVYLLQYGVRVDILAMPHIGNIYLRERRAGASIRPTHKLPAHSPSATRHIGSIMGKHDVIHNIGSTERILSLSEEDRATNPTTCRRAYREFREVWKCDFCLSLCSDTRKHADVFRGARCALGLLSIGGAI